jgi:hypothetical protein
MTEAAVLDALAHETLLGHAVDEAFKARAVLVRLLDVAGGIRAVVRVSSAPVTPEAFGDLQRPHRPLGSAGRGLAVQAGRGWRHLTNAEANQEPPAPGTGTARRADRTAKAGRFPCPLLDDRVAAARR